MNCEKATLLTTKASEIDLTFLEKLSLRVHLLTCKYCESFAKQNKAIDVALNEMKEKEEVMLTMEEKEVIKKGVMSE